jgi:FkbH-like protein
LSNSLDFLDGLSPTPSAYYAAVRRLRDEAASHLRPLRIGIAASFRADPLANYLIVEGARRGFQFAPWFTPYGQFELQCSTSESALFAERPDVVIIATRLEDLAPSLWRDYEALSAAEAQELAGGACARVERLITEVRRSSPASIVVFNFSEPLHGGWGIRRSPARIVEYANTRIERIAAETPGVVVYDFARLALEIGLTQLFDPRLDYVSRMPFGPAAQIAIAQGLARVVRALHVPPAKCLVVDLDNTLWGGVLGEVGLGGIALGNDYPGRVYRDFQAAVRAFRHRGTLLAIASKNNDIEAREVFEQHPDMVLRWEDFAAVQIHWKDKASSLRAIAEQLHIGLDALVFYDDSPVERAWVRNELPEVAVIEVPDDLLLRVAALEACEAFDQVAVSAEDRQRAALYEIDQKRELARSESASVGDFLSTLQIRVSVGLVDGDTLPRVAQLIQKTNQFNLTGRRYTEAELQAQLAAGAIGYWIRASDRFGDYGLVGAAFALEDGPGIWRIDSFVMSCRILGRQVEMALLAAIARQVFDSGAVRLIGDFVASAKNAPARDFYLVQGFEYEDGKWIRDFARGLISLPCHLIPTEGFTPPVGTAPPAAGLVPPAGDVPTVGSSGVEPTVGGQPADGLTPTVGIEPRDSQGGLLPTVGSLPTGRPGGRPQTRGSTLQR